MPGGTFGLVGDYGCSDSEGESGEDDPAVSQSAASNSVNSIDDGDEGKNKGTLKAALWNRNRRNRNFLTSGTGNVTC